NPRFYDDFTGCGSSVNLKHPRVLQMVMDSLRYWVEVCHVDGFRFDLATTLARGPNGFDRNSAFFTAIRQDPVLASVKLVAEPWDLGLGGYQVGAFPSQWSEWNDRYRTAMRRYWAGEGSLIGEVSSRMTGSSDLFNHDGRAPRASVNHITVHDGFTLQDLFSYNEKHNEANLEDDREGDDLIDFIGQMTRIRKRFPQLHSRRWLDGRRADGSYGVLWLTPAAEEMKEQDWNFPEGRFLAYVLGPIEPGKPPIFIVLNAAPEAIAFKLPKLPEYKSWQQLLNTADVRETVAEFASGNDAKAPPRSVLAFAGSA